MRVLPALALAACMTKNGYSLDGVDPPLYAPPVVPTTPSVEVIEDRFVWTGEARLDVLWVLDGSGLLADPALLGDAVPAWLDPLRAGPVDYHVGAVSADLALGGVLRAPDGPAWVDPGTPDPVQHLLDVGVGAAPQVQVAGVVALALAAPENAGFLRDDAPLHVVVVSDGEDDGAPLDAAEAVDALTARPAGAVWHCLLVGAPVAADCADTAAVLGGTVGDAADPAGVVALGDALGPPPATFALRRVPDGIESVRVESAIGTMSFDPAPAGTPSASAYTYDAATNSVSLVDYLPLEGDIVVVRYRVR